MKSSKQSEQQDDARSQVSQAKSVKSVAQSQKSKAASAVPTEEEKHEAYLKTIREKYQPIVDNTEVRYKSKFVGLNPNMRPRACDSQSKIFPMQGLWSSKQLMKSTRDTYGVSAQEQNEECAKRDKNHFKIMYEQKEYMEEYLKFKDVIANMKK